VVWCALFAIAAITAVVTIITVIRGPRRATKLALGLAVLVLGAVAALTLYGPASATLDRAVEGGAAECPFDKVTGSRMNIDHATRQYAFWQPCETASRIWTATVLGGYALVGGAAGVWMLRGSAHRRSEAGSPLTRGDAVRR
jgi:hypothetical protein